MATFAAFFDSNVLYPAELRNLLMHIALAGLFRAKWSAEVHEEWISSLLEKRPDLKRAQLERTRDLMDRHALDALVSGYESLIPGLHLPDPKDRHVLAAAIRGGADVIVTINLKDFPPGILAQFGIEAHLLDQAPAAVLIAARNHRRSLKNPPKTKAEYLDLLERQA